MICKASAEEEKDYSEPVRIDSVPRSVELDDKDFRKPERSICVRPTEALLTLKINNVRSSTNKTYIVGLLQEGSIAYTDRSYRYTGIPSYLEGQPYVVTANDDKCPKDPSAFSMSFEVNTPVTIFVARDSRYKDKPAWMKDFEKTNDTITLAAGDNFPYAFYRKNFPAGTITLGSNVDGTCQQEGEFTMYSVMISSGR